MKKNLLKTKYNSGLLRESVFNMYMTKYYSLWMSKYEIEGLSYQQNNLLFRRLWEVGKIAIWKIKNMNGEGATIPVDTTDEIGLTDYAPVDFNYLDFPVHVTLINNRGAMFIPTQPQLVDKDCVIGWAQKNMKPLRDFVEFYVSKITNVEMVLKTNLKATKTPYIIQTTEENENKVREFVNALDTDEDNLFFLFKDGEAVPSALISGAQYYIDKLYQYKQALEWELLTFLGVNSIGVQEKKEALLTAEVESNNQMIGESENNFATNLEALCERANKVLGFNLKLKRNEPKVAEVVNQNDDVTKDNNEKEGDEDVQE